MFKRLRRPSHGTVVAYLALFVALGGTAAGASYVISRNGQLGPGTVSGSAPPKGKHANVIPGSLTGADLKRGSIGGLRIADRSVTEADLALKAISPVGYGAATTPTSGNVCDKPDHCPLAVNRNVTSVKQGLEAGQYCIRVRGASRATNLMIAGLYNAFSLAFVFPVESGACASGEFAVEVRDQSGQRDGAVGFWFAVL
ncbi:MAG TPA: hypothetical protein VJT75_12300 [Thermoleophilaceae bacterium]|nr:hypothetical protein [Thermoleophilaceae bacterium]